MKRFLLIEMRGISCDILDLKGMGAGTLSADRDGRFTAFTYGFFLGFKFLISYSSRICSLLK